jgi:hypothetical protein
MNHDHSFRNLVIDILDDQHGIDQSKFAKLVEFSDRNYPDLLTDIFNAVDGADDRVWLDENSAEELRTKQ